MQSRILCGDAIEMMATLPDRSIDLIAVDPPYEVTANEWDKFIPFEPMWEEIWRVCRGAVVFTAMQPFSSALVMSQVQFFRHEWVWKKNKATGHLNAKKMPMRSHEVVLVFSKEAPIYNPQMTTGHKPGNYAFRRTESSNYGSQRPSVYGGSTERYPQTIQEFPVVNNDNPEKVHPTQKPVDMFEYFIRTYSNEGDTVLDFACGSGTTGVACRRTCRNFIGIEKDEKYAVIAEKRIAECDGPLFAGAA